MSGFKESYVDVRLENGSDSRQLLSEVQYTTRNGVVIKAKPPFKTDFTSGPKTTRAFVPRWGRHGLASIIHDQLYSDHSVSREEADNIFFEAMLDSGSNKFKAYSYWAGVRLFGKFSWSEEI